MDKRFSIKRSNRTNCDAAPVVEPTSVLYGYFAGFGVIHSPDVECEVRLYSGIQNLRGIFARHIDVDRSDCYVSGYLWYPRSPNEGAPGALATQAFSRGMIWSGASGEEPLMIEMAQNWWQYFWGPGFIHSIVFDFDYTLLRTFEDHMGACKKAILAVHLETPEISELVNPNLRELLDGNSSIDDYVKRFFISCNDAIEMAETMFRHNPAAAEFIFVMNSLRSRYRRETLLNTNREIQKQNVLSRAFPDLASTLATLSQQGYSLYVASLTDESLISVCLREFGLLNVMTAILGRSEYDLRSATELSSKSHLLLKVVNLSGIPTYRMIYIGDHINDLRTSAQAGSAFLEAKLIEMDSHISPQAGDGHKYFRQYHFLKPLVNQVDQASELFAWLQRSIDDLSLPMLPYK